MPTLKAAPAVGGFFVSLGKVVRTCNKKPLCGQGGGGLKLKIEIVVVISTFNCKP